jgi:Histidine acid phosphatase.
VADPQKAKAAIEARLPQVIEANRLAYEKARAAMQAILTPQGCGKEGQRACFIGEGTDIVVTKDGESRLEGPLANASGLTENLLLEYSEGKPLSEVGWGRAGDKLDEVLLLHNLYADIMRRTPYLASRRGSLLAEQVVDLLTDTPSRFKGAAPIPASAKMVAFLGHDTNLSNMSGFIDTKWTLPGQPDNTPPGAMLAFERWKQPDGGHFVRVRLYYQSLRETRAARATPRFIDVKPCSGSDCTLAALSSTIRKTIAPDCLNE